jgi:hypothetical protein
MLTILFCLMAGSAGGAPGSADLLASVDHLVYGTPDLGAGIAKLEGLLGVRAVPGGSHPGRGTRNALISLGPGSYLEIIGPDPAQPRPQRPRSFGLDEVRTPRLVAWAARGTNLEKLVAEARARGVELGAVLSGSRQRPDGVLLAWRNTDASAAVADRLAPFFIDWGSSPHPAASAPGGIRLIGLRAEHPEPERVRETLRRLEVDLLVEKGTAPALIATLETPRSRVELR